MVIDKETGVTLGDCETVSRMVSAWLDVEDPFEGNYNLEVSSPGLDRLFYKIDDYQRFVGRKVRTMLHRAVDGEKLIIGKLATADAERAVIIDEEREREYNVRFADIRWTRLEIVV